MNAATHTALMAGARQDAAESQQWRDITATCHWCAGGNRPERIGSDWFHAVTDQDGGHSMNVWCWASKIRGQVA